MKQLNNEAASSAYNKAVKEAYFKLLKFTKQLLATIERHELRCILQREDQAPLVTGSKVHELVSPLLYLALECQDSERLIIRFGFEQLSEDSEYSHITARFVRLLYTLTALENTATNIESCVNTNYVITNCSELYEHVEDRIKHHTFSLIKYKPAVSRRKQMKAVA
jgi:hypothetical protein